MEKSEYILALPSGYTEPPLPNRQQKPHNNIQSKKNPKKPTPTPNLKQEVAIPTLFSEGKYEKNVCSHLLYYQKVFKYNNNKSHKRMHRE